MNSIDYFTQYRIQMSYSRDKGGIESLSCLSVPERIITGA